MLNILQLCASEAGFRGGCNGSSVDHAQGCRFSVIFHFFRYFWPNPFSANPFPVFWGFFPQLFRLYVNILYFLLFLLSLSELSVSFVFIFCETAHTRRFSVIFTKVQWHPCMLNILQLCASGAGFRGGCSGS